MRIIHNKSVDFQTVFHNIVEKSFHGVRSDITDHVCEIITDIKECGDTKLLAAIEKYDGPGISVENLVVRDEEIESAWNFVGEREKAALQFAAGNIAKFHKRQLEKSWFSCEDEGVLLGQIIRPLKRVGIYAPGGNAPYPSTVLMNTIPARVAGVQEVYVATPAKKGNINPYVLVAAHIAGADKIFKMGGAHAIAAFAYGTASVPKVDKIVGPGNIYVSEAKRQVYGIVGVDMIAGPSEIVIVADDSAPPRCIAMDLISQAEHDELTSSLLITDSQRLAEEVEKIIKEELFSSGEITLRALENNCWLIIVETLEDAFSFVNQIAPEHVELVVRTPFPIVEKIENAGSIFIGTYSPVPIGDYVAGPNHTLPTGGTARFSSPLGVYDFIKRSNMISYSSQALASHGSYASIIAGIEGFNNHKKAILERDCIVQK